MTRDTTCRAGRPEAHRGGARRHRVQSNINHIRTSSYVAQQPPQIHPLEIQALNAQSSEIQTPEIVVDRSAYSPNRPDPTLDCVPPHAVTNSYLAIRSQIGQDSFLSGYNISNQPSHRVVTPENSTSLTHTSPHAASPHAASPHATDYQSLPPSNLGINRNRSGLQIMLAESPLPGENSCIPELPHESSTASHPVSLADLSSAPETDNRQSVCTLSHRQPILTFDSRGPLAEQSSLSEIVNCLSHPLCIPHEQTATRRRRRHRRHRRRSRRRRSHHRAQANPSADDSQDHRRCCSCLSCKICLSTCLQFQKVLIFFASFGVVCIVTGIILGVLRSPGNSFFTLSLMFVGLGLILLVMVLVGWKCTPTDHEPCHMLFGLGVYSTVGSRGRRRRERLYWLGGMLYPEFRNRRPPPSYAAAMHEQRNEMRRLSSHRVPQSPPPSYKSHTSVLDRPGIHIIFPRNAEFPNSNPPTYRITEPWSRPSLASFVESFTTPPAPDVSGGEIPLRDSVSSTQVLVEAEYLSNRDEGPPLPNPASSGVVNMSFDASSSMEHDENDDTVFPSMERVNTMVEFQNRNTENDTQTTSDLPEESCVVASAADHQRNESVIILMDETTSVI